MLDNSRNRIKSMALIHEKLYQSRDLEGIDFAEYIGDLAAELFDSYGVDPNTINLKLSSDNIFLKKDIAIPCGFIIT